jgi:hypothetical protein
LGAVVDVLNYKVIAHPKSEVSVIVATYGFDASTVVVTWDETTKNGVTTWEPVKYQTEPSEGYKKWFPLGRRAMLSVSGQPADAIRIHGDSLASARNQAGHDAWTEWLIFLDADDELSPGYVEAMLKAAESGGDIFKPATLGVVDGVEDDEPVMIPKRDLLRSNHIVIGAMVRRELFEAAGGFRELPSLEDWDLWLRLVLEFDAEVVEVPDAVYRVHVQPDSRNQNVKAHREAYVEITNRAWPIAREKGIREL